MFPLSFTSFNGSKSILVGAWSPSPNCVDNVFDLVANDLVTLLPPTKNGPTHVFLDFATFGGLVILVKNGLALVIVDLASFTDLASLAPILVHLPSFANLVDHVRDHFHDLGVIFNDNVIELSNSSSNNPLFVSPCKKQKKKKGRLKKNLMTTLANFKLNG
jgi:hypothetical protein